MPLTSIIAVGIIPAVVALIVTSLLAYHLRMRGTEIADSDVNTVDSKDLPPLWAALAGSVRHHRHPGPAPDRRHHSTDCP